VSVRRFPILNLVPGQTVTISPYSVHSIGPGLLSLGHTTFGSGAWPAANRALLIPFVLPRHLTVYKAGWMNGGAVSGNADIGIYDAAGVLLVSSGATAKTPINTIQMVDITDTLLLGRSIHYLALVSDDTASFMRVNQIQGAYSGLGCREKATSYPLPNSLTGTAQLTSGYVPLVFIELRSR